MSNAKIAGRLGDRDQALLFQGANMSELTILFKADHRTLKEKMFGLHPVGKRGSAEIYDVSEVARRMGRLTEDQIDAAMRRLNHADLPKQLTKEYWAGKTSKQTYELKAGDLWPTALVVERVGLMVKALKMELDLTVDTIERQVEMTDKQRELANMAIKGAKANMLVALQKLFLHAPPAPVKEEKPKKPYDFDEDDDEL